MTDLTAARTLADAADKAAEGDRYYMRAVQRRLEEFAAMTDEAVIDGASNVSLMGNQALHDEINMHEAGETELARIWTKVEKIRAKQAAKPKGSALPQVVREQPPEVQALVEAAVKRALEKAADECERLRNSYRRSVDLYDETDQQRRVVKYSGAAAAVCSENIRAIAANPAEVRRIAEGRDE